MNLLCRIGIHRPYAVIGWTTYECQRCPVQWVGTPIPNELGDRMIYGFSQMTGNWEVRWTRPFDSEELCCVGDIKTLVPRLQAAVRNYDHIRIRGLTRVR